MLAISYTSITQFWSGMICISRNLKVSDSGDKGHAETGIGDEPGQHAVTQGRQCTNWRYFHSRQGAMVAAIKNKTVWKSGLAPSDCDEPHTTLSQTTYCQHTSQRLDLFLLRTYWLCFSNTPS